MTDTFSVDETIRCLEKMIASCSVGHYGTLNSAINYLKKYYLIRKDVLPGDKRRFRSSDITPAEVCQYINKMCIYHLDPNGTQYNHLQAAVKYLEDYMANVITPENAISDSDDLINDLESYQKRFVKDSWQWNLIQRSIDAIKDKPTVAPANEEESMESIRNLILERNKDIPETIINKDGKEVHIAKPYGIDIVACESRLSEVLNNFDKHSRTWYFDPQRANIPEMLYIAERIPEEYRRYIKFDMEQFFTKLERGSFPQFEEAIYLINYKILHYIFLGGYQNEG